MGDVIQMPADPEIRHLTSVLVERFQWMKQHGISFKGMRDLYEVLGYDRLITPRQYRERYMRGGIAGRIVDAISNATWRGGFEIVEDENPKNNTAFEQAWLDLSEKHNIPSLFNRTDTLARQGRYATLLLGGPGELDQPLERCTEEELAYIQPFPEEDSQIQQWDTTTSSKRFGRPAAYLLRRVDANSYAIATSTPAFSSADFNKPVHWSRLIHIPTDNCLEDDVFGRPALERVWNLLDDLDKVLGGGAEAFWLRANQGLQLNFDKDIQGVGQPERDALKLQAEEYSAQIRRIFTTRGVDINPLGSDVANFNQPADAIVTQLAGATTIPKRILTGSEMGELASSQDRENWRDQVVGRQIGYAVPYVLRRTVDRFIELGVLPKPKAKYIAKFTHIQVQTEEEKYKGAQAWAATATADGKPVFTEPEIRDHWYGMEPLTDEQKKAMEPPPPVAPPVPQPVPSGTDQIPPDEEDKKVLKFKAAQAAVIKSLELAIAASNTALVDQLLGITSTPKYTLHPDWVIDDKGLTRVFKFANRRLCAAFLADLLEEANVANHHPDIYMDAGPDAVRVVFTTHSADDTVTELDFLAAQKADEIARPYLEANELPTYQHEDLPYETHTYSSTEVRLPSELAELVRQLAEQIPDEDLAEDGRESVPHITVKYGIHTTDVNELLPLLEGEAPIEATFGPTAVFEGEEQDVVIVLVDSPGLRRLNAKIKNGLEVTDTFPVYKPHATVAYVKSGRGRAYAGNDSLEGHTARFDTVVFSPSEGVATHIRLRGPRLLAALPDRSEVLGALEIGKSIRIGDAKVRRTARSAWFVSRGTTGKVCGSVKDAADYLRTAVETPKVQLPLVQEDPPPPEKRSLSQRISDLFRSAVDSSSSIFGRSTLTTAGGPGSGNFGHSGRPGEVGGSAPADGGGGSAEAMFSAGTPEEVEKQWQEDAKKYLTPGEYEKLPPGIRKWKVAMRKAKAEGKDGGVVVVKKQPEPEVKKLEPEVEAKKIEPEKEKSYPVTTEERERNIRKTVERFTAEAARTEEGKGLSWLQLHEAALLKAKEKDERDFGKLPENSLGNRSEWVNRRSDELLREGRERNAKLTEEGKETIQLSHSDFYAQAKREDVDRWGPWVQPEEVAARLQADKNWNPKEEFDKYEYGQTFLVRSGFGTREDTISETEKIETQKVVIPPSQQSFRQAHAQTIFEQIAKQQGFDPNLVVVRDNFERKFDIHGIKGTAAGTYYPETGQAEYYLNSSDAEGTMVHEIQHAQFDYFRARARDEENILHRRYSREQQSDFRGTRYFTKDGKILAKRREDIEKMMPHLSAYARVGIGSRELGIKHDHEAMKADDGTSSYSKMYWTLAEKEKGFNSKASTATWIGERAIDESLAELRRREAGYERDYRDREFGLPNRLKTLDKAIREFYARDPEAVKRFIVRKQRKSGMVNTQ